MGFKENVKKKWTENRGKVILAGVGCISGYLGYKFGRATHMTEVAIQVATWTADVCCAGDVTVSVRKVVDGVDIKVINDIVMKPSIEGTVCDFLEKVTAINGMKVINKICNEEAKTVTLYLENAVKEV